MKFNKSILDLGKYNSETARTLIKLERDKIAERIFAKDYTVWKKDESYDALINNRLGWLRLPVTMKECCGEINSFADEIRSEGYTYAVVLGMGGSSMCPEVCRETFGIKEGYLRLFVLDSTDPDTVSEIEKSVEIEKTLFIVSSKSGGTIEVDSFFRYFFEKVKQIRPDNPGQQFIAVTDPSTALESLAKENGFRKAFINPPDIGGRYSALSYFGLVPAAVTGVEIQKLLGNAEMMMERCSLPDAGKNIGLITGAVAGTLAKRKRDKLTFILSENIKSFGYWAEQLIAESTGKEGTGVIPVEGEKLSNSNDYGNDRLFVSISCGKESKPEKKKIKSLLKNKNPYIRIRLNDLYDIGGQFYLWEFATAVMGHILKINPFDEPNVKESKDNTGNVLKMFEEESKLPVQLPVSLKGKIMLYSGENIFSKKLKDSKINKNLKTEDFIKYFFRLRKKGDYVALMAYIQNSKDNSFQLQKIRELVKKKLKTATTSGYGPRFLHSTGQLHKGGGNNGMFIQIVNDDKNDIAIPGKPYSFSVLKQSQAIGDFESLVKHKRRCIRINIGNNTKSGLKKLYGLIKNSL
jgi:glucose-6-phosphate isomerase